MLTQRKDDKDNSRYFEYDPIPITHFQQLFHFRLGQPTKTKNSSAVIFHAAEGHRSQQIDTHDCVPPVNGTKIFLLVFLHQGRLQKFDSQTVLEYRISFEQVTFLLKKNGFKINVENTRQSCLVFFFFVVRFSNRLRRLGRFSLFFVSILSVL